MSILAQLSPLPIMQFFDGNGIPLAGGKLFSFQAGTSTPQPTYADATASVANPNPVILDSQGRAEIWLTNVGYKLQLTDASNVVQWTVDNVFIVPPNFIGSAQIANGAVGTAQMALESVTSEIIQDFAVNTDEIAPAAVTNDKIAPPIPIGLLDPNLDVSGFNKNLELALTNTTDLGHRVIPQYPWTAPVLAGIIDQPAGSSPTQIAWSPNEEFLAVGNFNATPFVNVWQRFERNFYRFPNSAFVVGTAGGSVPPAGVNGVAWSPDGQYFACTNGAASSPFLTIFGKYGLNFVTLNYPASAGTGGISNPDVLTTVSAKTCQWSRGGEYLAFGLGGAPWIRAYQRLGAFNGRNAVAPSQGSVVNINAGGGYFSKVADPAILPSGTVNDVSWTRDGQYLACASNSSPFVLVYRTNPAGTLTSIGNPAILPPGNCTAVAWSPQMDILALGMNTAPFIQLYSFSGGTLTALATPAVTPAGTVNGLSWSSNGLYLACGGNGSGGNNQILVYSRAGTTFSQVNLNPQSLGIGIAVQSIAWSPTGQFLAFSFTGASPYFAVWQTSTILTPSDSVNWVRNYVTD